MMTAAAVILLLVAALGSWAGIVLLGKGPGVDDEIVASATVPQPRQGLI